METLLCTKVKWRNCRVHSRNCLKVKELYFLITHILNKYIYRIKE